MFSGIKHNAFEGSVNLLSNEITHAHFNSKGFLNKKGLEKLNSILKNPNSKLSKELGDAGVELFFDFCSSENDSEQITKFTRNLIIANKLLFSEELKGPDSSLIRQVSHLHIPVMHDDSELKLKKFLLQLSLEKNEFQFHSIYSSFMNLYMNFASRLGINYEIASHDLISILVFTRAQLKGLEQLDLLYYKSSSKKQKKAVLKISNLYLKKLSHGVFASSIAVLDFFSKLDLNYSFSIIQKNISQDRKLLFNISEEHYEQYLNQKHQDEQVHDKFEKLRKNIEDHLNSIKKKKRR